MYTTSTSTSSSSTSSPSSAASGTITTPKIKVINQKQINAIRDLRDRLQCLSDLLKGRPFNIPKSASFLQKKILGQLYDEMAKKCDGDLSRVNFSRVFSVLPQAMRQLFVNSYQSLLWNDVAIDRCNQNNKNDKDDNNQIEDNKNNNKSNDFTKCSIIELKSLLREKGLKVSGNKSELVARLLEGAKNVPQQSEDSHNNHNNQKKKEKDNNDDSNNKNNNNQHVSGFKVTDTAVVGDIVLVDLKKQPLTAWHVAAQNISLNGNQIPLWSKDVGIKVPVPQEIVNSVVINSNTPYNSNPNSPLYGMTKGTDYVGGSGDRSRDRDSREGDRGRGRRGSDDRNEVEEKEEVKEVKACYHLVTRYNVTHDVCVSMHVCVCICVCVCDHV